MLLTIINNAVKVQVRIVIRATIALTCSGTVVPQCVHINMVPTQYLRVVFCIRIQLRDQVNQLEGDKNRLENMLQQEKRENNLLTEKKDTAERQWATLSTRFSDMRNEKSQELAAMNNDLKAASSNNKKLKAAVADLEQQLEKQAVEFRATVS